MRHLIGILFILQLTPLFSQPGVIRGKCVSKKGIALSNVIIRNTTDSTISDLNGDFEIRSESSTKVRLSFSIDSLTIYRIIVLKEKELVYNLGSVKLPIQEEKTVTVRKEINVGGLLKLPALDIQKTTTGGVERTLIYTTAASSNNELTSSYNVRGGSYDENLVYVNGFLINRPFLTRSGQQEGLSFIFSSLVKDIRFSAGGFESVYGDKLSSVLDINYVVPDSFNYSIVSSLLGIETHIAHKVSEKFNYVVGARYRSNGYLLNTLPTKGAYNPIFYDAQALGNYAISDKLNFSTIIHVSNNNFRFTPQTQQTDFGTINEAYRLKIYFDGQEQTQFQTITAGTSLKWRPSDNLKLDFYTGIFQTNEREYFDVQGQYYINLLETNPGKENFGDSVATLGVGTFLTHARNQLKATIVNLYHNGTYFINDNQTIRWGVNYQQDQFKDQLSEWKNIDSAGFTLTAYNKPSLELANVIKGNLSLHNQRLTGFLQHAFEWGKTSYTYPLRLNFYSYDSLKQKQKTIQIDTLFSASRKFILNTGLRIGYTEINKELFITPRISFSFFPRSYFVLQGKTMRRNAQLKLATGLYYQPPFYREFRTFDGELNTKVKSQKSAHIISSYEFNFSMWNRPLPFKFSAEAYYKYLWDVNPYEIDNVRTRYYATNDAVAYAYGFDINVHGEFVEGIHSFFKMGFLSSKENLLNDSYKEYYNKNKEKIIKGYTIDDEIVDSATIHPGYIPRPTDQLLNFAVLFQDKMPGLEMLTAQMGLFFGTRLPYGPPDFNRYKDTLRQKEYFRVDLGLSYDLLFKKRRENPSLKTKISDAFLSFEIFNLMGINNVLSKQWVQDISGKYYAIPNYLTQRLFNVKFILRF